MAVYYNEIDPYSAQWLRNLIAAGHLPEGDIDERSITDVQPADLREYRQCHFFAGIGGWPLALRWAGAEDIDGLWTGSCPCQPLSVAGQQKGHADERHIWPAFYDLIAERKPAIVFGEQVSGKIGFEWFAGVRADLEDAEYVCGAAGLPAASVGSPHLRQRIWWMANAKHNGHRMHAGTLAGTTSEIQNGLKQFQSRTEARNGSGALSSSDFWRNAEWVTGADETDRRIKPGIACVAHGIPARVGKLRALGNAIVPQVAEQFIRAYFETDE